MGFRFEKKIYGWRDLLRIPYQCSPSCTVYTMAQKILTGMVCVLLLFIEAAVIDRLLLCRAGEADIRIVLPLMPAFFAGIIWKRMGYSLGRVLTKRVQGEIEFQFQRELVKKCACVPYRLLEDRIFQNIKTHLEQNAYEVIWMIMQQMGNVLLRLVRIVGVYLVFYIEDIRLGLFMTLITLPVLYFSICNAKKAEQRLEGSDEKKRKADYYLELIRSGSAIEEKTIFDSAEFLGRRYEEATKGCKSGALGRSWQIESSAAAEAVVLNIIFALAILFQTAVFAQGRISLGMFIALAIGSHEAMFSLYRGMNHAVTVIESAVCFLDYLTAMANMPEVEGIHEQPKAHEMTAAELEFVDVSFRYPRAADYVLRHLSFKLPAGRTYAFVGENGAGKSTIAKLLAGMYDSYEGKILINGKELRDYSQGERKAAFAAVSQDSARYAADVAANGGQDEKIRLSDGQWQRLVMEKLLANPVPICILDEPAAALDPIAESELYEQLAQPEKEKTMLLISHRLGSVKGADRIFVLKDGCVAEEGEHEELMRARGLYAEMYESQSLWYQPTSVEI